MGEFPEIFGTATRFSAEGNRNQRILQLLNHGRGTVRPALVSNCIGVFVAAVIFAMSRIARVVVPGVAYHVTHRGNRRGAIFFEQEDREYYLALLAERTAKHGLLLHAYCLMSNHVHLLAVPTQSDSLARAIGEAHMLYSRWTK